MALQSRQQPHWLSHEPRARRGESTDRSLDVYALFVIIIFGSDFGFGFRNGFGFICCSSLWFDFDFGFGFGFGFGPVFGFANVLFSFLQLSSDLLFSSSSPFSLRVRVALAANVNASLDTTQSQHLYAEEMQKVRE
jgi:hypothetical protein